MKFLNNWQKASKELRESFGITDSSPIEDLTHAYFKVIDIDENNKGDLYWAYEKDDIKNKECHYLEFENMEESEELVAFYNYDTDTYILFLKSNEINEKEA